ncbi:MAG TPA: DNA polymerase Y family protein [Steroidobacteraceae bacterium]|nr:DNA polymerase Y family protein [Steroidobacteraceae bacterium]
MTAPLAGKHRVAATAALRLEPARTQTSPGPADDTGSRVGDDRRMRARAVRRELWLAVHLPQLMLESLGEAGSLLLRGGRPEGRVLQQAASPLAIVDQQRGSRIVCACNDSATRAGIQAGMALNSALALLPELEVRARAERRERALLEALAGWGLGFTPRVSLERPDAVLLELRGSLQLFGGVAALLQRMRAELQAAGLAPLLALTPAPLASLWFAYAGVETRLRRSDSLAGRLAALPIACTRWPERSLELLGDMGVRTLGDCMRLPRDGLARRLGPQMLQMLDRATGRLPDPRPAFVAREHFRAVRQLEPEVGDVGRLEIAATTMLGELCDFLRRRGCVIQSLEFRLRHRAAPATRLPLHFAQPTARHEDIAVLLHERLLQLALSGPVRALQLQSGPLTPARSETGVLLREARHAASPGDALRLVERLRARLGVAAVQSLRPLAEHRPESAWCLMEPVIRPSGTSASQRQVRDEALQQPWALHGTRPLWLLGEPQLLPGKRPDFGGELVLEEGPERIESGWWDGRDVTRDYYVARNPAGVRLWVYRERGPGGRWFLQGVFG